MFNGTIKTHASQKNYKSSHLQTLACSSGVYRIVSPSFRKLWKFWMRPDVDRSRRSRVKLPRDAPGAVILAVTTCLVHQSIFVKPTVIKYQVTCLLHTTDRRMKDVGPTQKYNEEYENRIVPLLSTFLIGGIYHLLPSYGLGKLLAPLPFSILSQHSVFGISQ